jgi:hypothetical protein
MRGDGGENIRDLEDGVGRRIFEILKMRGSVTVCDAVSNGLWGGLGDGSKFLPLNFNTPFSSCFTKSAI